MFRYDYRQLCVPFFTRALISGVLLSCGGEWWELSDVWINVHYWSYDQYYTILTIWSKLYINLPLLFSFNQNQRSCGSSDSWEVGSYGATVSYKTSIATRSNWKGQLVIFFVDIDVGPKEKVVQFDSITSQFWCTQFIHIWSLTVQTAIDIQTTRFYL